ncbi:hybrid signal transduction histidine kinase A-like [Achroia grisella]|uniref:hybrid signal transduction histidine kinase A-like n=1 Tax=Achroia grisella TaxID=688607 RepID=UPI0027D2554B|nr:hybrid signal transduction histidine kinase A-like [Achroia grisella]
MKIVLQTIRILVIIQIIRKARCQDGFSNQDLLRLHAMVTNEGQGESIPNYNTNGIQRDPNTQSGNSVNVPYHTEDQAVNEEYNRADRARSRKVYHIKNPFQNQDSEIHEVNTETQDSGTAASSQYAAMQYSLPPEEFLQQMRENQYYQQQQQQQLSTPAPNTGYTATPQPSYQYSTISPNYDNNNQISNQIPQLEPKTSNNPSYYQNTNSYQYGSNSYLDGVQSSPSPVHPHLSSSLPNNQFVSTQSSAYISSASPIFLSSPPNLQHYISSPMTDVQTGSSDYSNRVSTVGSFSYDNNKVSANPYESSGIKYPMNVQQYQSEQSYSTPNPSSSPYSELTPDSWHSSNSAVNTLSKSMQDMSLTQYQNYPYNNNQQEMRSDSERTENMNGETHRIGNMPAANTMFMNVVPPEYQLNNLRARTRDAEQETAQSSIYSHGDFGWKLANKKIPDSYTSGTYGRLQFPLQPTPGSAISQMSFHMDTGKPNTYEAVKSASENLEAQEFAKAAAKAQERQQQQQQFYGNNLQTYYNNNHLLGTITPGPLYANNDKLRNKHGENSNLYAYSNIQTDLITASPYYYANSKENNIDLKTKQPFDHDKALKNIVPIDVSNVVSDSQSKSVADNNNRQNINNFGKDSQLEQNLKQYYRSITDAYYKDKNSIYGFNIKTKPEDLITNENKHLDLNSFYAKQQQFQEPTYNQGSTSENKRYIDGSLNSPNSHFSENSQSSLNIQQQRPLNSITSDVSNIFKLNDIPYRFSSGLPDGVNNNNFEQAVIPTPLPMRINQNVGSHQLDVATNILNKLILNKQPSVKLNRPELDPQGANLLSTINGFKVANPFNVDLKLVAEMLKGKPALDETQILPLRDQFSKTVPLKLDISQLHQLLLKNDNNANYGSLNEGLGAFANPYIDIYNSGRFPYQGVKYSRSQEEEESIIPIADSSNNHPIGAVIEQIDDMSSDREASTLSDTAVITNLEDRPKNIFNPGSRIGHRHPNSLVPGRHSYQRKYPKSNINEPYPLLKPPPQSRNRGGRSKYSKQLRRRRVNKTLNPRIMKTEPLFEADADIEDDNVSTVLRPPNPISEAKIEEKNDEDE